MGSFGAKADYICLQLSPVPCVFITNNFCTTQFEMDFSKMFTDGPGKNKLYVSLVSSKIDTMDSI